jgi:hypothetical protein
LTESKAFSKWTPFGAVLRIGLPLSFAGHAHPVTVAGHAPYFDHVDSDIDGVGPCFDGRALRLPYLCPAALAAQIDEQVVIRGSETTE